VIDPLRFYPIVWAVNQTNQDLNDVLITLYDEPVLGASPIEYLPVVSLRSYFHSPRKREREYLSKLIHKVFIDLSNLNQWHSLTKVLGQG
jgi:hypothetical protein